MPYVELILLSALTGALSHFVQLTFQKGMIFRKYYAFIFYWFHFKPRKTYGRWHLGDALIGNIWSKSKYGNYFSLYTHSDLNKRNRFLRWFFKPLGGCIYCNGTWIFIITFSILHFPFSLTEFVLLFLGMGAN
jgi:hypothetical protein